MIGSKPLVWAKTEAAEAKRAADIYENCMITGFGINECGEMKVSERVTRIK